MLLSLRRPLAVLSLAVLTAGVLAVRGEETAPGGMVGAPPAPAPPHESPLTPAEEQATFSLPPGFTIELVAAESEGIGKFVTVDWDQRGRMWSMTALEYPVDGNEDPERARALYENPGRDKVLVFDHTEGPGPHAPRIFAEGLAIPLGILPQNEGVYVQHGPWIELLQDTDGDGRADKRTKLLSGFGVQDSHLLMHQFTRMPGGWIWAAQGAFNSGKVKTSGGAETDFPNTRMARFRPDGSDFQILCNGPCNIWGFAASAEGELFIQEANDYGFPCMPFQIGANYPGCADRLFKSYAPEYPGTAQDFRMGGTGLSGLALSDPAGSFPGAYADVMYVANPIIRKIQALKLRREGPRWAFSKLPDFIESSDPMFRPVSIQFGPDGALYIVDWYNKIISHNEVPRNHPDRDKTRGRIWRVRHTAQALQTMPDLTACPAEELVKLLGSPNHRQAELAWQALVDRKLTELAPTLTKIVASSDSGVPARLRALWALEGLGEAKHELVRPLLAEQNRNIRQQAIQLFARTAKEAGSLLADLAPLANDPDPQVRAEVIRAVSGLHSVGSDDRAVGVGKSLPGAGDEEATMRALALLIGMAKPSLNEPMAPATRNNKPVRVGEAYDREFERYLVREALEQNRAALSGFLASKAAQELPIENRVLATLALEPRDSASSVAKLLPQLGRAPNDEELLRLARFPEEPGVADSLRAMLTQEASRDAILQALLKLRSRIDPEKLAPVLASATAPLLTPIGAPGNIPALQIVRAFHLAQLEPQVREYLGSQSSGAQPSANVVAALEALSELRSDDARIIDAIHSPVREIRQAALEAAAHSKDEAMPKQALKLWAQFSADDQRKALEILSATPSGARAITAAFAEHAIPASSFDGPIIDHLQTVLQNDSSLDRLIAELGNIFRPVLRLPGDGSGSFVEPPTPIVLNGPFTVETWVRLDPGIANHDGILGAPGALDMNFAGEHFRVWAGREIADAIVAKKKMAPENWTHIAVTRDGKSRLKLYIDGELDNGVSKSIPQAFENVRIGWTQQKKGTAGMLAEFRIWKCARTAKEIRNNFDRTIDEAAKPAGLVYRGAGAGPWGHLHGRASIMRMSDYPPLYTPQEAQALDAKFAHYRELAKRPGGDPVRGKGVAAVCMTCHLIQGEGGNIAPNISGAGTMGLEALLRNIITPNAGMEAGYRIYRVEMKSGELLDSFFVSGDATATVVRVPGGPDRRIPKTEIRRAQYLRRSLMPERLLDAFTPKQVTDLFAYLLSLKG